MAGLQTIDLTLVSPLAGGAVPIDPWWLRIDQIVEDDRATTAEVAELVDTLYDLNPCVETEETGTPATEEAEPTPTDLLAAAKVAYDKNADRIVDLAACRLRLNGDYITQLKVVRSHQSEGYRLVVGVPSGVVTIESTVITNEEIDTVIDIDGASEHTLEFPVAAAFHASWQGSVTGDQGSITPVPAIKRIGNTLFWAGGSVKGSIRVVYQTVYDLVTVSVPGKPKFSGATVGDQQDATVLAFFHRLVFLGQVSTPPVDDSADQTTLGELCDWSDSDTPPDDDPPPPEPPPDGAEYGCLSPNRQLADPEYYELKCCTPPPFGLPDCAVSAAPKPGKGLDPAVMAQIVAAYYPDPVEFIAVGPGPQGCGRTITTQRVRAKSCCDEIIPMSQHPDNPDEITPGGRIRLCVLDGAEILTWTAGGGLFFDNGSAYLVTTDHCVWVNAPVEGVCANAVVQVEDGCDRLSLPLDVPIPPLEISEVPIPIPPNNYFEMGVTGGLGPFIWTVNDHLTLVAGQGTRAVLLWADDEFCGVATVTVSDGCADVDTETVRSTEGAWVAQPFDECNCAVSAGDETYNLDCWPTQVEVVSGDQKCVYAITNGEPYGWRNTCDQFTPPVCGKGPFPKLPDRWCQDYQDCANNPTTIDGDCCRSDLNAPSYLYIEYGSKTVGYYKWVCAGA